MMKGFAKYEEMRSTGAAPLDAYMVAKSDGLDVSSSIRMLRAVFELPLEEAKKISFLGDTGKTVDEHGATHTKAYLDVLDEELGPL